MTENVRRLVLGDALSATSRAKLTDWLVGNTTGDSRLRAGFPKGWRVGDKTGSGNHGVTNDVAIAWPPERQPIIRLLRGIVGGWQRAQRHARRGRADRSRRRLSADRPRMPLIRLIGGVVCVVALVGDCVAGGYEDVV
jgi:beta-lactamase class A